MPLLPDVLYQAVPVPYPNCVCQISIHIFHREILLLTRGSEVPSLRSNVGMDEIVPAIVELIELVELVELVKLI